MELVFLKQLEEQLNIKEESDWYNVTKADVIQNDGRRVLYKYRYSVSKMLKTLKPDYKWETTR